MDLDLNKIDSPENQNKNILTLHDDSSYLRELSLLFPSVSAEQLLSPPYRSYVQLYRETYKHLKFYREFSRPNRVERAKIYRALHLCCKETYQMKGIVNFSTAEALIIKSQYVGDEGFNQKFNHYMTQPNSTVFIPPECDRLDRYHFSYYRKILTNFIKNERIPGTILRMNERDTVFLFITLDQFEDQQVGINGNTIIDKKWKEYLQGGVHRSFVFSPCYLESVLQIFKWAERLKFRILSNDDIEITVKSPSLDDFDKKKTQIVESQNLSWIDLPTIISDEYEVFGILQILNNQSVIPLMGTHRVFLSKDLKVTVKETLITFTPQDYPYEGTETYTQDDFKDMSKYRLMSLIRSPSGNFYSFLDLAQTPIKIDPLSRVDFPDDFRQSIELTISELKNPVMTGFPPIKFEPQLITIISDPDKIISTISFYIRISDKTDVFWIIPDLRETEYAELTLEAIRVLITKWSDRTLFKGSFSGQIYDDYDLHSIFSPVALYVFEYNSIHLEVESYPRDIKIQAKNLKEQIRILSKCK